MKCNLCLKKCFICTLQIYFRLTPLKKKLLTNGKPFSSLVKIRYWFFCHENKLTSLSVLFPSPTLIDIDYPLDYITHYRLYNIFQFVKLTFFEGSKNKFYHLYIIISKTLYRIIGIYHNRGPFKEHKVKCQSFFYFLFSTFHFSCIHLILKYVIFGEKNVRMIGASILFI